MRRSSFTPPFTPTFTPIAAVVGWALVATGLPALAQSQIDPEADPPPEFCDAGNGRASPYSVASTGGFDHDRFKTRPIDREVRFGAFVASFDGPDDDDGDRIADFRATPEWVAYEMQALTDLENEFIVAPAAGAPETWYELPGLRFLDEQSGIENGAGLNFRPIGDSYDGVEDVWVRGDLASTGHAARRGWQPGLQRACLRQRSSAIWTDG